MIPNSVLDEIELTILFDNFKKKFFAHKLRARVKTVDISTTRDEIYLVFNSDYF